MPGWKAKSPQRSYHPGRSALAVLGFDSGFWRPMPTNLRPMPTLVPELSCHNKGFRCPTFSPPNAHTCKKPAIARGFRRRSVPTLGQNPNSAPNAHTCPRAFLSGTGVSAKFHSLVIRGILINQPNSSNLQIPWCQSFHHLVEADSCDSCAFAAKS